MHTHSLRFFGFIAGFVFLLFSGWAWADPPSRVARLGYIDGAVSFSADGEDDWDQATLNRPLGIGDRLWTEGGARAEIQIGGGMIRMSGDTAVSVLNLDDRITQLQLSQGRLHVRLRHLDSDQEFEVDTPNLAFSLRQPGEYRIDVDADGHATQIAMHRGEGEVFVEDASYRIDAGQAYRFSGSGLRDYQVINMPPFDAFDRWASERDRRDDRSASARHVSADVIGYQDLDAHGVWRVVPDYGDVWFPSRVAADWSPFHDGHWSWIDPWGWTWVDDAPWGFAVSHYGRWANLSGSWGWLPGPPRMRAYYAPALVVFVGGDQFNLSFSSGEVGGGVAWFPLGPREVYRPSYSVSRGYFEQINRSNTRIDITIIDKHYHNNNAMHDAYANRHVRGAVVAVPRLVFEQSRPVGRAAIRASHEMQARQPVAFAPHVMPTEISVRGGAPRGGKPPNQAFQRHVIAHTPVPPARVGFAAQRRDLAAQPGRPLDDAARRALRPAATTPMPNIKLIQPRQETPRKLQAKPAPRMPHPARPDATQRQDTNPHQTNPLDATPHPADLRSQADRKPASQRDAQPGANPSSRVPRAPAPRQPQQEWTEPKPAAARHAPNAHAPARSDRLDDPGADKAHAPSAKNRKPGDAPNQAEKHENRGEGK